jgi:hypothetical protein
MHSPVDRSEIVRLALQLAPQLPQDPDVAEAVLKETRRIIRAAYAPMRRQEKAGKSAAVLRVV